MQAPAIVAPVRDMGEALRASLANALSMFLSAIPRIIGFAVVLLVGWFVASLIAKGVAALLRAIKFNDLAHRSGFGGFVQNMGVRRDPAGVIADVAKWFVRLITLVVAFDTLGLPAVSGVLQRLLLWLPNLIVALAVLVIGGLAAGALSRLVRGATAQGGFANPDTMATVAKVAVWAFAIIVAVNQLGIATNLINTLVIGVIGAVALASGLAFGLGGRERAAAVLDRVSRQAEAAGPNLSRASAAAGDQARAMAAEARATAQSDGWRERSGVERRRSAS
jgi:Conserved TM helix